MWGIKIFTNIPRIPNGNRLRQLEGRLLKRIMMFNLFDENVTQNADIIYANNEQFVDHCSKIEWNKKLRALSITLEQGNTEAEAEAEALMRVSPEEVREWMQQLLSKIENFDFQGATQQIAAYFDWVKPC